MMMVGYSLNESYYPDVVDSVCNGNSLLFFRQQYHLLTTDHEEKNLPIWYDFLLDKFTMYNKAGFSGFESKINSVMDGLEAVITAEDKDYFINE